MVIAGKSIFCPIETFLQTAPACGLLTEVIELWVIIFQTILQRLASNARTEEDESMKTMIKQCSLSALLVLGLLLLGTVARAQSCKMDATITSSNITIPAKINPAKKYDVRVTVENSGTCTWDTTSKIRLSIKIVKGPSGAATQRDELTPIVDLKYKVLPGKSQTFNYEIEGPYYLGRYTLEWIMLLNNKPFGNEMRKDIEVVPPK
jgi:hypothetical protein